jgi:hypothetical protein
VISNTRLPSIPYLPQAVHLPKSDFIITKTEVKQGWAENKLILPQNPYMCEQI